MILLDLLAGARSCDVGAVKLNWIISGTSDLGGSGGAGLAEGGVCVVGVAFGMRGGACVVAGAALSCFLIYKLW